MKEITSDIEIIESYKKWKCGKDEDRQLDKIHEFAYELGKDDLLMVFEYIENQKEDLDMAYSELRGLLKEHAQFPEQWDTDERLREWLKEKGEL